MIGAMSFAGGSQAGTLETLLLDSNLPHAEADLPSLRRLSLKKVASYSGGPSCNLDLSSAAELPELRELDVGSSARL